MGGRRKRCLGCITEGGLIRDAACQTSVGNPEIGGGRRLLRVGLNQQRRATIHQLTEGVFRQPLPIGRRCRRGVGHRRGPLDHLRGGSCQLPKLAAGLPRFTGEPRRYPVHAAVGFELAEHIGGFGYRGLRRLALLILRRRPHPLQAVGDLLGPLLADDRLTGRPSRQERGIAAKRCGQRPHVHRQQLLLPGMGLASDHLGTADKLGLKPHRRVEPPGSLIEHILAHQAAEAAIHFFDLLAEPLGLADSSLLEGSGILRRACRHVAEHFGRTAEGLGLLAFQAGERRCGDCQLIGSQATVGLGKRLMNRLSNLRRPARREVGSVSQSRRHALRRHGLCRSPEHCFQLGSQGSQSASNLPTRGPRGGRRELKQTLTHNPGECGRLTLKPAAVDGHEHALHQISRHERKAEQVPLPGDQLIGGLRIETARLRDPRAAVDPDPLLHRRQRKLIAQLHLKPMAGDSRHRGLVHLGLTPDQLRRLILQGRQSRCRWKLTRHAFHTYQFKLQPPSRFHRHLKRPATVFVGDQRHAVRLVIADRSIPPDKRRRLQRPAGRECPANQ